MARIETDPNYTAPTFSRATAATDLFKKEDVQALAAAMSTHDHDAAGKGLAVTGPINGSQIADGSITSAKILDGTVTTTDLHTNAATMAAVANGVSSSPTTTSATYVDIPDLAINFTTTAGAADGATLLVWLHISLQTSTTAANVGIGVDVDGIGPSGGNALLTIFGAAGEVRTVTVIAHFNNLTPGVHSFKGRWSTNTGTITATQTFRSMKAVEFIR